LNVSPEGIGSFSTFSSTFSMDIRTSLLLPLRTIFYHEILFVANIKERLCSISYEIFGGFL
jgi:hypothetical protein